MRYISCLTSTVLICLSAIPNAAGQTDAVRTIRAGFVGLSNDFTAVDRMAGNGMNAVVVSNGGHLVDFNAPDRVQQQTTLGPRQRADLGRWQQATSKRGMHYFPVIELYGTGDRLRWKLDRHFVDRSGKHFPNTPCPLDATFWQQKLGRYCVQIATWSAAHANVAGILIDAEMYGADQVAFPDACFCSACRSQIVAASEKLHAESDLKQPANLATWRDVSGDITRTHLERIRRQVHAVNPRLQLGGLVLDHASYSGETPPFYKAITQAWGTPQRPVLVFSEATYQPGFHAAYARPGKPLLRPTGSYVNGRPSPFGQGDHPGYIQEWRRRWQDWGAHAEFVGGLWVDRIPDENWAENLYHMGRHTRGYWIYDMLQLGDNPRGTLPGGGAVAYWRAIATANQELRQWEQAGDTFVSRLKMRPFSLPAPGLSQKLWTQSELPYGRPSTAASGLLFRGSQAMVHIPAERGDQVRLRIDADNAHRTKKKHDVVAIAVIDPQGRIIQRDKLTSTDLASQPRTDGRYSGARDLRFQAPASGTYVVALKGLRYAYGLGPASHAWLVSLHNPTTLFRPQQIYLRSTGQTDTLRVSLNTQVAVTVRDHQGQVVMSRIQAANDGSCHIIIQLSKPQQQILQLTFDKIPWQVQIRALRGMQPWLGARPDAPFPVE